MKRDREFYSYMIFRGREKERERHRIFTEFVSDEVILCGMLGKKISLLLYLRMKEKRKRWWAFKATRLSYPLFPYMMLAVTMAALAVISRWGGSHPYVALSWERRVKHSCTKKYAHIGSEKATFRLPLAILLGVKSQTRQMEKLKTSIAMFDLRWIWKMQTETGLEKS